MSPQPPKHVLTRHSPLFTDDIERIYLHAVSGTEPFVMGVVGPPGSGVSEALRGVYDRLFLDQRFVIPFYFSISKRDGNARSAAARYLYEFLLQAVAFRKRDAELISAAPDVCRVRDLAPLSDAAWVSQLCEECDDTGPLNDERAFIRSALSAPFRAAAAAGGRVCIIIDDLHKALALDGAELLLTEIAALASTTRMPLILGSHRRFRPGIEVGSLHRMQPAGLERSAEIIDAAARSLDVRVAEQVRDLLAVQMEGRLTFIRAVLSAARNRGSVIEDYRTLQQIYSELLTSGEIGRHFDEVFADAAPDPAVRRRLLEQLGSEAASGAGAFALSALQDRLRIGKEEFERLSAVLNSEEILLVDGDDARMSESAIVHDHLRSRGAGPIAVSASVAAGDLIASSMKRAPRLMSREYRRAAAVGLRDILSLFDLQEVPRGLVDYQIFRDRVKGENEDAALAAMFAEADKIKLPQIVHAAGVVEYLPEFTASEPERAMIARGFSSRSYTDEDEMVWLAAEIDSKLEADEDLAREWTGRLERAAEALHFSAFRMWLVAPEGFSQGALDHLADKNAYGSSRRQAELLKRRLTGPDLTAEDLEEFEVVIPVGEETELIAAHVLEEISRRYAFPAKAVNQMKTALVEACINAAEHGLAPDRKIYQKFAVGERKVIITVSNRGLRLADRAAAGQAAQSELGEGRRGWGLNLIRTLMDEVRVEPVEDGTRIVMTKYIPAS